MTNSNNLTKGVKYLDYIDTVDSAYKRWEEAWIEYSRACEVLKLAVKMLSAQVGI